MLTNTGFNHIYFKISYGLCFNLKLLDIVFAFTSLIGNYNILWQICHCKFPRYFIATILKHKLSIAHFWNFWDLFIFLMELNNLSIPLGWTEESGIHYIPELCCLSFENSEVVCKYAFHIRIEIYKEQWCHQRQWIIGLHFQLGHISLWISFCFVFLCNNLYIDFS